MNDSRNAAYDLETDDGEIPALLAAIYERYGYDFRDYEPQSLRSRIWQRVWEERVAGLPELESKILDEPECLQRLLRTLSLNGRALFDEPGFYLACRRAVLPVLRTYPSIRIWDVGCSTGEQLYSLAILLWEEGLHERATIYSTDTNEGIIREARAGAFPVERAGFYAANYRRAGGQRDLSEYYTVQGEQAIFHPLLQSHVVWSTHSLVTDASFNDFHFILCRNVLVHFNKTLQSRVLRLIHESLVRFGVLALGQQEDLPAIPWAEYYTVLNSYAKLYRRRL
jgi:chemotaxis protein methyltransferase CheR